MYERETYASWKTQRRSGPMPVLPAYAFVIKVYVECVGVQYPYPPPLSVVRVYLGGLLACVTDISGTELSRVGVNIAKTSGTAGTRYSLDSYESGTSVARGGFGVAHFTLQLPQSK